MVRVNYEDGYIKAVKFLRKIGKEDEFYEYLRKEELEELKATIEIYEDKKATMQMFRSEFDSITGNSDAFIEWNPDLDNKPILLRKAKKKAR